jgi:methionyl aminopeptidase
MSIETEEELKGLLQAGKVVRKAIETMKAHVEPGITTGELDQVGANVFAEFGARSAPTLAYGFPGTTLISINDEVVHGIPGNRVLRPGDLVTIDVTVELNGFIADAAESVVVPPASTLHLKLCECTRTSFEKAIRSARAGRPINAIGKAVEKEVRSRGFSVIPALSGHGIGRVIHEAPLVPNYEEPSLYQPLTEGLVITIEPIITSGSGRIYDDKDGWTVKTRDRAPAAHYEHTIVITKDRPILLTAA